MKRLFRLALVSSMLLFTQLAFAQQRFELDMQDRFIQGQDVEIPLKQEIFQRYGVRLQDQTLTRIQVVAKSRQGQGLVWLNLANDQSASFRINGNPQDFNNPAGYTFDRIRIETRGLSTANSPWRLAFRGNVIVRSIVVFVESRHQPVPQDQLLSIHRFYTGAAHFWTLSQSEGAQAGFRYEGVGFQTFVRADWGRQEIFRCYTGRTHFVSTLPNCEGQRSEGSLGFVSQQPNQRAPRELVRCYRGGVGHLITTNRNECINAGYGIESVLGFVP